MRNNAKKIIIVGLFIAILAVSAKISLPLQPIPFTLQLLVVLILPFILPASTSLITVLLYIFIGLMGVPVLAEGGGIAYVLKPSFGFLLGMAAGAPLSRICFNALSKNADTTGKNYAAIALSMLIHIIVVYLIGGNYMYIILRTNGSEIGYWAAWKLGALPYIPFDLVKLILAVPITHQMRISLKKGNFI